MSSQVPLYDLGYETNKSQIIRSNTEQAENPSNFKTIQNPTNVTFRTAMEKTSNLGKRTCNEYKTIFEDVKFKVNYKKSSGTQNSILNITNSRNALKKEEHSKIRSVFSGKSKDRFSKK